MNGSRLSPRRRWLAGTAIAAVAAALPGAATARTDAAPRSYRISLPLRFDAFYRGDIATVIATDGSVSVDAERMIALLGANLDPAMADQIRSVATGGQVALSALAATGITAAYDPATLQLDVAIPVRRQGTQILSANVRGDHPAPGTYLAPAGFAASAIVTARQSYLWYSRSEAAGLRPVTLATDIAANIGGPGGVGMFGQVEYDGSRNAAFRRGNFQFFHEDEARAIRYSAGDVAPATAGFQTAPLMGGISIERQYGAIQPLRSIRPSGQFSFVLDRAAMVDVVVNGSTMRTLRLGAGQYGLRDFPFFNGLNQVELYIVDDLGRRLLATFSQYYSARLIDRGVLEFGADTGVLQNRGGVVRSRYGGSLAFSGYGRYGLTDGLTVGANAQAARGQWSAGIETTLATPFGTLGMLASASDYRSAGGGSAFLFSYEGAFDDIGPLRQLRLNVEAQRTSRRFTAITLTTPLNRIRYSLSGRMSAVLPERIGIGLSAARYGGRDGQADQNRYALNLSRGFGRLNVNASFERIETRGRLPDDRVLLALSLPFDRSRNLRGSYDGRGRTTTVELSRYQRDEIDSIGYRAGLSRGDAGTVVNGEIGYANNRFAARVTHSAIGTASGTITGQRTDYTLSTQIGIAGDKLAFGRPVGPRFAIVDGHPTLHGASVDVWQGPVRNHAQARSSPLGPALVSVGTAYLPTQIRVDVKALPVGYDPGPGLYRVRAGAASGFAIRVGSDASRAVIGTADDANGRPLPLLGGSLRRSGDPAAEPILVFTNRNGRFVASGLAPGAYILTLSGEREGHASLHIPAEGDESVSIGKVRVDGLLAPDAPPGPVPVAARPREPAGAGNPVASTFADAVRAVRVLPPAEAARLAAGWAALGSDRLRRRLTEQGMHVGPAQLRLLHVALHAAVHRERLAGGECRA